MQATAETVLMFALQISGRETILIVALMLIVVGSKRLPAIGRRFGEGMRALDDDSIEAGKAVGGIYGKPAAEALTPDNQAAELYDPAAFSSKQRYFKAPKGGKVNRLVRFLTRVWHYLSNLIRKRHRT
ncbi:MAG: twin-arginine translocase TatA/TatE family subunit [Verrucomicrobia bacterium]|nr:twin-arginine translocase TatA/TatE family subunit [Verrucomicrobiota bacterium]